MSNAKNTVLQAATELFGDKDPAAVDRWDRGLTGTLTVQVPAAESAEAGPAA